MSADKPVPLGIQSYCNVCTQCADACPPRALPFDAPKFAAAPTADNSTADANSQSADKSQSDANIQSDDNSQSPSTLGHVKKWSANCEKCFGYWAKLKTDCAICMRVCPFSRPQTVLQKVWYLLATGRFRKIALWWDRRVGLPVRVKPKDWWSDI